MKHIISFLLIVTIATTQTACPPNTPVGPVVDSLIDCLGSNRPKIDQLLGEFKPLLTTDTMSWPDVKQRAVQAGREVGGCFIMELTQLFLSGTRSAPDAKEAHDTAEAFRKEYAGGASFRTMCVREDGTKSECKL